METNQVLELYPEYSVSVTLFHVTNFSELKEMLIKGKLEAALVNASMVPDIFPVLLAANKAVHLSEQEKMKTRSVYSEVVFNLSPSNNISESLKIFGLNEKDPAVLVVVINKGETNNTSSVISLIKGEQMPLTRLQSIADENRIKKVYKIPESEMTCGSLTDAVVTRIATKDAN
ncbi:EKC/KEOPS complex subunit TPRKB-like [Dendronephthya gigantea]|uniref:EKC/KEOPS complex subunit TPRKB-like n=1 Tax=Dendronephthya gigantea TaxID=151771 RepID=UPI00106D0C7C|nr:EKC/KEOPS complex subunit TPRKB-like [Dendronephthya gigantea]XP_028398181.1 EKC/KEOPS complex subunit TPRKB-like [Dendronephthya gigantea]